MGVAQNHTAVVRVRARRRSFVASLLWMTAKNGLGARTMRLGEAEGLAAPKRGQAATAWRPSFWAQRRVSAVFSRVDHNVEGVFVVLILVREHGGDSSSRKALLRMTAGIGGLGSR
jgi:hypothetical protein